MFDWFAVQSDEVKGAVILALGGAFTVVVGLVTALVNAVGMTINGVWSRRYEKRRMGYERLLEKRSQNAEIMIEKLSQFHIQAFTTMNEIREIHSKLRTDIRIKPNVNGIVVQVSVYTPGGPRVSSPFDVSVNTAKEKLVEMRERVKNERQEADNWFHHEAFRHWAWFENASGISRSMGKIQNWYISFYFDLTKEVNALSVLYKSTPSLNLSMEDFDKEREVFAKLLEKHSLKAFGFFQQDDELIAEMSKLQSALLAHLS